jgi:hypothetical protein
MRRDQSSDQLGVDVPCQQLLDVMDGMIGDAF